MFSLSSSGILAKYFYSADCSLSKVGNQFCKKMNLITLFLRLKSGLTVLVRFTEKGV
jgi:hypothetical protein